MSSMLSIHIGYTYNIYKMGAGGVKMTFNSVHTPRNTDKTLSQKAITAKSGH